MSGKRLFLSRNVVLEDALLNGGVLVDNHGKIVKVLRQEDIPNCEKAEVLDFGNLFLISGIIDSHVHINEPGRTEWEGFNTATKAASAGGITTIVDMPLNSIPPTTTVENLNVKIEAAKNQIHVDVAFWGGLVKGNSENLLKLVDAGVVGFKCFMCPSGVDEFPYVDENYIEEAMKILEKTEAVLAFHAELDEGVDASGDGYDYETFLKSRPSSMEVNAIKAVIKLAEQYRVRTHIVHLSATEALPLIKEAKRKGIPLTVESCHHYLNFESEKVPNGATQFKCCPPVRTKDNKERLWKALATGLIDMIVSDHSPCTPDLKLLGPTCKKGDFLKAWGGIASVQFGLSLFWTSSKLRGFPIFAVNKYLSRAPAKLVRLHNRKGQIAPGFDADLVIWDPEQTFRVEENMIWHKNKVTPYIGMQLSGKVHKTFVRGRLVYDSSTGFPEPSGEILLKKHNF